MKKIEDFEAEDRDDNKYEFTHYNRSWDLSLPLTVGIAVILMVANLLLLGLPGILIFTVGDLLGMMKLLGELHGDSTLPTVFYVGFLWPPAIPIFFMVARRINVPKIWRKNPVLFRMVIFLILLYLWAFVLSTAFHLRA
jgi:hypothetical protein